jgi:nitrite reductase/ring-hydroxylating ferredoxin subunit
MGEPRYIDLNKVPAAAGTTVVSDNFGKEWLIAIDRESLRIFFNECPHQGQPLKASNSKFVCTGHNWTFDQSGENMVKNGQCLKELRDFEVRDEKCYLSWEKPERKEIKSSIPDDLELVFHSHACLEIFSHDFRLITDPWTEPTTYDGNWVHWPNKVNTPMSKPNVIVVTHEHPDHFHESSIAKFPKDTQIVIPKYLNMNLRKKIQNLGYANLVELDFNDTYMLSKSVKIKFLRPSSKWEDAVVDLDFFGFKWLNMNDAGYVSSEEFLAGSYHLLTATFDVFASDYPMMWKSVEKRSKSRHIEVSKISALNHVLRLSKLSNSEYYLPFASFWRLNPSKFANMESEMKHLTLDEIHNFFQANKSETKVLDLIPGETFSFALDRVLNLRPKREQIKNGEFSAVGVPIPSLRICVGQLCEGLVEETQEFLLKLAEYSSFFRSEDVELSMFCTCGKLVGKQFFGDDHAAENKCEISVEIPIEQLEKFIVKGYSFEALRIGYWIQFSRNKNIYTPNFLRLMAFGASVKYLKNISISKENLEVDQIPLAQLLNLDTDMFARLLNRSGLPCVTCKHLNQETLGDVIEIHRLSKQDRDFLRSEVSWILESKSIRDQ